LTALAFVEEVTGVTAVALVAEVTGVTAVFVPEVTGVAGTGALVLVWPKSGGKMIAPTVSSAAERTFRFMQVLGFIRVRAIM
jgi:hypothetical protein